MTKVRFSLGARLFNISQYNCFYSIFELILTWVKVFLNQCVMCKMLKETQDVSTTVKYVPSSACSHRKTMEKHCGMWDFAMQNGVLCKRPLNCFFFLFSCFCLSVVLWCDVLPMYETQSCSSLAEIRAFCPCQCYIIPLDDSNLKLTLHLSV